MSITAQTIDQARLDEFMERFVGDLGAAISAALVVIGDGLHRALGDGEPATADELASRTGTDARYVREWLSNQAADGYVTYDPGSERFFLTPEHSFALPPARARGAHLPELALRAARTTARPPASRTSKAPGCPARQARRRLRPLAPRPGGRSR